jgi:Glycosyltransferases involved in cell wall biogenesis
MGVSVVIPTKNGKRYIKDLLKSLRAQTVKPEIIVIDSSSRDETAEIAKRYADVFVSIREEEFNHGLTRNLGVEISRGDIVVFFSQTPYPKTIDFGGPHKTHRGGKGSTILRSAHTPPGTKPQSIL